MFVFDNTITAGTVLVRQQIESQNWTPSGGTAGWVIKANGDATFKTVTLSGDLQSANYVAGTSGYKLTYATGAAEFNANVTVNNGTITGGVIRTAASGKRVQMQQSGGDGYVRFYGAASGVVQPAFIRANDDLGTAVFSLSSEDIGDGVAYIEMTSPDSGTGQDGQIFIQAAGGATNPGQLIIDTATSMQLWRTVDISPSSFNPPFQIGDQAAGVPYLRMDNNEIMVAMDDAAHNLYLNASGGTVIVGNDSPVILTDFFVPALDSGRDSNTTQGTTTSVTPTRTLTTAGTLPAVTVRRPFSGKLLVCVNGKIFNSGAGASYLDFEIRDTNSGGTQRLSPAIARAASVRGTSEVHSSFIYATDVLAGSSTNLWIGLYAEVSSGTGTYDDVSISVIPLP